MLELFVDNSRRLPIVDPQGRECLISCGAALGLVDLAGRCFGYLPQISLLPQGAHSNFLARVQLAGHHEASGDEVRRFLAICNRRTTRLMFEERMPPDQILAALPLIARQRGVELRLITEKSTRLSIAEIVADADKQQMSDPRFRLELADWMHPRRTNSNDGMSDAALGLPDAATTATALVVRTFDLGKGVAAHDRRLASASPVLAILATDADAPIDWLMAGMALSDILLEATADGLCTSFLNQPIEVQESRSRFRQFGVAGTPQLLLRIGYGRQVVHSARRELRDVVIG